MNYKLTRKILEIDKERLERILHELARIGADPAGGVSRLGLSLAECDARSYLAGVSQRAGLIPAVDAAGNLLVRRPAGSNLPVLLIGSHVDSVRQGGWLDGAYGVAAAIETLTVLERAGVRCRLEPVVVGFSNEEGALVQYPFWGSRALAGTLTGADHAQDRDGRSAASYLRAAGGDPASLAGAAWQPGSVAAYLELHIEQGTVLEQSGVGIGIVDRITGRAVFDIAIRGESGHPGTTPMNARQDALAAASQLVLGIEDLAAKQRACATATVGYLEVSPNTTNTIPGSARLSAEIRDIDPVRISAAEQLLESAAEQLRQRRQVEITVRRAHHADPVATDDRIRAAIGKAAADLGLHRLTMPSRAGHDAQIMAALAPIGMIFVPSKRGISHKPQEDTAVPELVAGANVLLHSVLALQASEEHLLQAERGR